LRALVSSPFWLSPLPSSSLRFALRFALAFDLQATMWRRTFAARIFAERLPNTLSSGSQSGASRATVCNTHSHTQATLSHCSLLTAHCSPISLQCSVFSVLLGARSLELKDVRRKVQCARSCPIDSSHQAARARPSTSNKQQAANCARELSNVGPKGQLEPLGARTRWPLDFQMGLSNRWPSVMVAQTVTRRL